MLFAIVLVLAARAPEIALMHRPPVQLQAGDDFVIAGTMVGASEVERAEIRFRQKGDTAFQKAELELEQGEEYKGTVAAVRAGTLEYYVVAYDFLSKPHEVFASAKRPQRVIVLAPVVVTPPPPAPNNFAVVPEPAPITTAPPVTLTAAVASPIAEAPAALEQRLVFTSQQLLASGLLTVVDALALVSDLSVSRGTDGRFHIAAMGRRDDAGVRILLDGQEMNGSATGSFDLDYPITLLERIVVTLSNARATDTSGALAVIALESKRAHNSGDLVMRAVAGGYLSHLSADNAKTIGTYDFATAGGAKSGSLGLYGRAAAFYSGGAQLAVDPVALPGVATTPSITNDRQLRLVLGGTFDGTVSSTSHLGLDVDGIYNQRGNYLGTADLLAPAGEQRHFDFRTRLYAFGGDPAQVTYKVQLGYLRRAYVEDALLAPPGYVTTDINGAAQTFPSGVAENLHLEEHVLSADARVDAIVGQYQRLSARAQLQQHLFSDFGIDRNANAAGDAEPNIAAQDLPRVPSALLHRTDFSLSMADTIRPVSQLDIDLGVRFSLASDIGVHGVDIPTLLTPVGGMTYRPLRELAMRLSFDTAMRAPTVLERYERTLFEDHGVLGNTALRYTAGRTAAFDTTYSGGAGGFRYLGELRGFYNGARGSIVALDGATGVDQWQATQSIDTAGVSAFGRLGFLDHSSVSAGVTWDRAYSHITGSSLVTLLTDTPQLDAVVMSTIEIGPWLDLFVSATYTGERRSDARTVEERLRPFAIPAQVAVNVQLRSRPVYGLRALVIVHDAFDEARLDDPLRPDRLPGLIPREGFLGMLGLEYAYEKKP